MLHWYYFVTLGFHATIRRTGHMKECSMCGIVPVYNSKMNADELRLRTLTMQRLIRHRGPDGSGIHVSDVRKVSDASFGVSAVAHERLAIVDPLSGNQPLFSEYVKSLTVNGEIYNYLTLKQALTTVSFQTESDCEAIIHVYDKVNTHTK